MKTTVYVFLMIMLVGCEYREQTRLCGRTLIDSSDLKSSSFNGTIRDYKTYLYRDSVIWWKLEKNETEHKKVIRGYRIEYNEEHVDR